MQALNASNMQAGRTIHSQSTDEALTRLGSGRHGLTHAEALVRLEMYGPNLLPQPKPPAVLLLFLRQFASPLIYILIAAALLSLLVQDWSDALFIGVVLMINAVIGTFQELSANRAAAALRQLVPLHCRVLREGETYEIEAAGLVPGDIILLESGDRIPADVQLLACNDLRVDESLLTGESLAVGKNPAASIPDTAPLGDRANMLFAGTIIDRGRAQGVVVDTGDRTELGRIAAEVLGQESAKPPLIVRMESLSRWISIAMSTVIVVMVVVAVLRGMPVVDTILFGVALAVAAIPEGLPVAVTVALAVALRRMARRHVIIRKLVAVEALGSCTVIAADKTGTLTINRLTATRIVTPDETTWEIGGQGLEPEGSFFHLGGQPSAADRELVERLSRAAVLAGNEAFLGRRNGSWSSHGDAVDIALLVMAHKAGIVKAEELNSFPQLAAIPFESGRLFAAGLHDIGGKRIAFVKGGVERILPMCSLMDSTAGAVPVDRQRIEQQAAVLSNSGFRVLAVAEGSVELQAGQTFSEEHLRGLTLLGLIGMEDPLREEAKASIRQCHDAGIRVAMLTGDHPDTAFTIARELGMLRERSEVVTGQQLHAAGETPAFDALVAKAPVFARVEPQQKYAIVRSLMAGGHFAAVTGDGANDAPALNAANVGVAMGKSGTDVARETADIIITDDNIASIVAGVEEGRIAYANIRKVVFLLFATGGAELVLCTLTLLAGLPLPLVAVQLLWLNLVTNGIQHVGLAFEPAEGDELRRRPRPPQEPIFNRPMIEQVLLSSLVMGAVAFGYFDWLLARGASLEEARNHALLLMVLFENVHVFNCRSETQSLFAHNPLRNRMLLMVVAGALLIHVGAMHLPGLNSMLGIAPIAAGQWWLPLVLALTAFLPVELLKWLRRRRTGRA